MGRVVAILLPAADKVRRQTASVITRPDRFPERMEAPRLAGKLPAMLGLFRWCFFRSINDTDPKLLLIYSVI